MDELNQTLDAPDDLSTRQAQDPAAAEVMPAPLRVQQPGPAPRAGSSVRPDREFVIQNLSASLIGALRDGTGRVLVRQSIKLRGVDAVRPDICVLRDAAALTSKDRPRQDAIQLIIEVSGNAMQYDFDRLERYALGGVGEVWIVDLQRHRLLVYQAPSGNSFAKRQLLVAPERVGLPQLPGAELKVAWIFC